MALGPSSQPLYGDNSVARVYPHPSMEAYITIVIIVHGQRKGQPAIRLATIGTNYLRLDRCPKNFCQVMASWGPQVRNVATKRDVFITLLSLGNTTIRRRSSVGPRKAVWCVGTSCDFPLFMRKANLLTQKSVRLRCRSMRALNGFLRSQSRYY